MERKRLKRLLETYVSGTIGKTDLQELLDYVESSGQSSDLEALMATMFEEMTGEDDLPVDTEDLYQRIVRHPRFPDRGMPSIRRWWWYASAAVLLVAVGIYTLTRQSIVATGPEDQQTAPVITQTETSAPSDRPLLRLADGRLVDLDSLAAGGLTLENGVRVTLTGNTLQYHSDAAATGGETPKNTVVTPKGRQYQIVLPDGSRLWLNAASVLTYPVQFSKDKREVEISGEAYFTVQHTKDWPFVVATETQKIEVLGTRFNVTAYPDDRLTKTTLEHGSLKVSPMHLDSEILAGDRAILLTPGQQAISADGLAAAKIASVDPAEVISWKENLFVFNNEEISEVMKKISRWYDVKIEYKDGMAGKRIGGAINRFEHIEELMDALQATGLLHYQRKGGVIVVMK